MKDSPQHLLCIDEGTMATHNTNDMNIKIILALTLVHFTGDFFNSFITPLLPTFAAEFSLSMLQIGLISGLGRFLAFIVQPTVGYLADRYRTRLFSLGGPTLAMVFVCLACIAPSYTVLLVFVALASSGSAMFHPAIAGMVHTYGGKRLGFSLSIFNMGGTLGFGLGPLFITWFVASYGLHMTPVMLIPGLLLMAVLFKIVPLPEGERLKDRTFLGSLNEAFGGVWKLIAVIWLIMVLRAFCAHAFRTFLPVLYANEGFSLMSIGFLVSLFTIAGTVSGLLAGYVSYKTGYKKIFYLSFILSTPAFLALLFVTGKWVYPVIFVAGFSIMATLPLGVALAQELAPKGRSMVSSIMMGFAFGLGGILSPVVGGLADIFSIRSVLTVVAFVPLLTTGLIHFLPEGKVAPRK